MPIHSCPLPGGAHGYQWGGAGKCYSDRADAERQAEAAYSNGYTGDSALPFAAGVLLCCEGMVWLCQRNDDNTWATFGGMVEEGEDARAAARRELQEEAGIELKPAELKYLATHSEGAEFVTYYARVTPETVPTLCPEHSTGAWFTPDMLPEPLHPGIREAVEALAATPYASDALAFDRASVRQIDEDGRMRVEVSAISKANVCPYYGREIPGWQGLALDPNRIYMMWRHPEELAKAAPTFRGVPLLCKHIPHTSKEPVKEHVAGSVGSLVRFEAPYLLADLNVWTDDDIAGIETGEQRELSSSYAYDPDMTPGVTPDGVKYDGVMRNITGNHVALVSVGRAGADVFVGDQSPLELPMKKTARLAVRAAVRSYVRPALASDAAPIDLKALITPKATPKQIAEGVKKHFGKKFDVNAVELAAVIQRAADEAMEDEEEDVAEDEEEEDERERKAKDRAKDNEPPAGPGGPRDRTKDKAKDKDEEEKRAKDEEEERKKKEAEDKEEEERRAEDAALIEKRVAKKFNDIRDAERDVRPLVGELAKAMDSAEAVYRFALTERGHACDGVNLAGLKALVAVEIAKDGGKSTTARTRAEDSAGSAADFDKLYPNALKMGRI